MSLGEKLLQKKSKVLIFYISQNMDEYVQKLNLKDQKQSKRRKNNLK